MIQKDFQSTLHDLHYSNILTISYYAHRYGLCVSLARYIRYANSMEEYKTAYQQPFRHVFIVWICGWQLLCYNLPCCMNMDKNNGCTAFLAHLHTPGLVHVPWSHPGSQMAAGTTTYIHTRQMDDPLSHNTMQLKNHVYKLTLCFGQGTHSTVCTKLTCEALVGSIRPAVYADPLTSVVAGKVTSIIIPRCTVRCAWTSIVIRVTVHRKAQSHHLWVSDSIKPNLAWVATRVHCTCYPKLIHIVIVITFEKRAVLVSYFHIEGKGTLSSNTAYTGMNQHCNWRSITSWDWRNLYSPLHCTRGDSAGIGQCTTCHSPGNCPQSWMS